MARDWALPSFLGELPEILIPSWADVAQRTKLCLRNPALSPPELSKKAREPGRRLQQVSPPSFGSGAERVAPNPV